MGPRLNEKWLLFGLVLVSGVIGLLVHPFYDWTGSNQSSPSPLLWRVPLVVAAVVLVFCAALPRLQISRSTNGNRHLRFRMRDLLIATAVIAVLAAIGSQRPNVVTAFVFLFTINTTILFAVREKDYRIPTATLLAVMYLPYLGLPFQFDLNIEFRQFLGFTAGLPGFLPGILTAGLLDHHPSDVEARWIPVLITSIELAVGFLLIRVGPRATLAYSCVVTLISMIGAMALNAMLRA